MSLNAQINYNKNNSLFLVAGAHTEARARDGGIMETGWKGILTIAI